VISVLGVQRGEERAGRGVGTRSACVREV
jgi:hypothetical protein